MGDLIYSLLFCKILGVNTMYVDGGCGVVKFNWESANFILPLLQHQPYMKNVELYTGQKYDSCYGTHPEKRPVIMHTDLTEYHASKFGISKNDPLLQQNPWLSVTRKIAGHHDFLKTKKILINRTARYHGDPNFYLKMLSSFPLKDFVFAGLEEEYILFKDTFQDAEIDFVKTESSLELLSVVDSVPTFLGNESLICAMAIGLGKNCYIEYGRSAANYIFNRQNIFYF